MSHLQLECKLARNYTLEEIDRALAYLLIKAIPDKTASSGKLPLNLVLILDVSGSMKGEKIECARNAASLLVESLTIDDYLSLVVFNDKVSVIVPKRKLDDRNVFFNRIRDIKANGGTHMFRGMGAAIEEIGEASPSCVNRMLLFTDGLTKGEGQCLGKAKQAGEGGIAISTFGIGDDYNEELLAEISRVTLGSAYHLQYPKQIEEQFMAELKSADAVGITNANLTLQLSKGVALEEMHRIVPHIAKLDFQSIDERMFSANIGVLDKDEISYFGARLFLPARPAGHMMVAQAILRYDIPSLQIVENTVKGDVLVEYTKDRDLCGRIDKEVMGYFDQLSAQDLIEQATRSAQAGNITAATQKLNQARALTQRVGNSLMTHQLQQAIEELDQKGTISAGSQKTIRLGSTHTVRLQELDQVPGINEN